MDMSQYFNYFALSSIGDEPRNFKEVINGDETPH
jgi:hypothetical protein